MREEASFRKFLEKVRASNQKLEIDDQQVVDEKKIKEAIKIISSLNKSRKLLVSEVLRLVMLILLVPTTNAVSERLRSTLRSKLICDIIYDSRTCNFQFSSYYL